MKKKTSWLVSLSMWLMIGLCAIPLSLQSRTIDESKNPLSQGIMVHASQLCCDIEPVLNDAPLTPGVVTFSLRIVPHWICEAFVVTVVEVDNLKYFGEMSWTFEASAGDTVYFPISVELPENDTTGLVFEVGGCKCRIQAAAYFTTTAVDAKFYPSDPSKSGDRLIEARMAANRRAIERARDSIAQLPSPPPRDTITSRQGLYDKDGNFCHQDSLPPDFEPWVPEIDKQDETSPSRRSGDSRVAHAVNPKGGYTEAERLEYERLEKEKKTAALYAEMREKEKQPCTIGSERYGVGGEVWIRSKGEYEFHKSEPVTDPAAYIEELKQRRRAEGVKPETHVTLDLRRAEDLDFVRTLVDSLVPHEDAGIYETVINNKDLDKVSKRGILWNYYPMKPSMHPGMPDSPPKRQPSPKKSSGSSSRGRDTLFYDGGETNWSSKWTIVTDSNTTNGRDYWGRVSYDSSWVFSGDSSIWCAENGDMPEGWWYDDNMEAVMIMTGGINISTSQNDTGKYVYWYTMEDYDDWFSDIFSFDGITWHWAEAYTGFVAGWDSLIFAIASDENRYYQQFRFHSGTSGHESWAGAFLDDFSLTASSPAEPDLECCTPSGWSGPIVLSSELGFQNDSLTAEEITYVDIAIKNTGDTSAGGFNVAVYVDDEWCYDKGVSNIDIGECIDWTDEQIIVVDPGWHTIHLEIDPEGWVAESDEGNNQCQKVAYFYSPPRYVNLEPGYLPGWYGPVTPSMIRGNHQPSTLYSGDTTFIDWAVKNTGDTISGSFWTRLKYDGQVIQEVLVPPLIPSAAHEEDDFPHYIALPGSGWHTLAIEIDYLSQVDESDEYDNSYDEAFEWVSATIGAYIKVEFQQLKNAFGGIWHSADSARIELRDADPGDTGQVLLSGWTDWSGRADLGMVFNLEEDQTPQDIFIRVYSENPHAVVGGTEYSVGQYSRVYPSGVMHK